MGWPRHDALLCIDEVPPVEGVIALEGKVVSPRLIDGDVGDVSRKGPDKIAEWRRSDTGQDGQESILDRH